MINPCLRYFVHINDSGIPAVDTMFATTDSNGQATCKRKIAPVPPFQVALTKECRPLTGLRYFYKQSKLTGRILPNSMFSAQSKPVNMCIGQFNILEFIITTPS